MICMIFRVYGIGGRAEDSILVVVHTPDLQLP